MKNIENVWSIVFTNFRGENYIVYFKNKESAEKSFKTLYEYAKDFDEFDYDKSDNYISWFDSSYNEYSTYAILKMIDIPFNDIITDWEEF